MPRPGIVLDQESVLDVARQHLAGYKLPKCIIEVAAIARTSVGKADYEWARDIVTR